VLLRRGCEALKAVACRWVNSKRRVSYLRLLFLCGLNRDGTLLLVGSSMAGNGGERAQMLPELRKSSWNDDVATAGKQGSCRCVAQLHQMTKHSIAALITEDKTVER
jgi:hypothetical protein